MLRLSSKRLQRLAAYSDINYICNSGSNRVVAIQGVEYSTAISNKSKPISSGGNNSICSIGLKQHNHWKYSTGFNVNAMVVAIAISTLLTASYSSNEEASATITAEAATVYRLDEVAKHTSKEKGVWVIYKDGVYDITRFVANHPGGQDKIMLAAGGDIAPFWNLYRQHFNSSLPMELLQSMRVGSLHEEDVAAMQAAKDPADSNDPYSGDPMLSPVMRYISRKPINAEAPQFLQTDAWITPKELWFVRNHHPVCDIDAATVDNYEVALQWEISSEATVTTTTSAATSAATSVPKKLSLTVADLRKNFKAHKVVSTLQCGGNRRAEMTQLSKTNGSPWCTAISTAEWTGVRMRDLLLAAGLDENALYDCDDNDNSSSNKNSNSNSSMSSKVKHVIFVGKDGMQASIPIGKALSRVGDVLLAYEMNGEPLPPQHGFPLRAVVPGHVGVRNVKWVSEIKLSDEEATGPWQRGMSYKGFGPSITSLENIDVEKIPSLQEQPVTSAITLPRPSLQLPISTATASSTAGTTSSATTATEVAAVPAGAPLTVQGYSYSGGGRGIVRVDVSIDGGRSWRTAALTAGAEQPLDRAWAWTFWECDFDIPSGEGEVGKQLEIICKATDAAYNVQPDSVAGIWNLRGINNNAWHRVNAVVVAEEGEEEEEE